MVRNIQIAVVDTAGFMRDGLCALLKGSEELEVVGAIDSDPKEISTAAIAAPDVALMPSPAGLPAVAALKKRWPGVHILMLTSARETPPGDPVLQAGVTGYVCKSSSQGELLSAIQSVSVGRRYVGSAALAGQPQPPARRSASSLSDREREVMCLIAEGFRTREMAKQLSLSHKTIEKHRSNLMRKLGLRSATAVAAYAITHGYVVLAT
jgi:two-component system, NarL family, response regulator NreC